MKSNRIYLSLLISLSLLASCSKEANEPTSQPAAVQSERISFSAQLPDPHSELGLEGDQVRTTLAENGHQVLWTEGTDKISVYAFTQPTINNEFTATEVDGSEAVFEGEASVSPRYDALYPYDPSATYNRNGQSIRTTLQTNQTAVLGSFADGTSLAVATLQNVSATNRRFRFRNATALLKISFSLGASLSGKSITEIRLLSGADANGNRPKLSGPATVTLGTASVRPTTSINNTGASYISLSNGGATLEPTTPDKAYYMVVPTEGTGQKFSLVFIASDGSGVVKSFSIKTPFVSGKIKSVNVHIDDLQRHMLTNVPLIDIAEKDIAQTPFVREEDGSINYYKNIDQIERVRNITSGTNPALVSLRELEYYSKATRLHLVNIPNLTGTVEIDQNPSLTYIAIAQSGVTSVRISNVDNLTSSITIAENKSLTHVDIDAPKMTTLGLNGNSILASVDLSKVPSLMSFNGFYSGLTALDFSHNPLLEGFNVHGSKVERVDISQNPKLKGIVISSNRITELDLSNNPEVISVNAHYNGALKMVKFAQGAKLQTFDAVFSQIATIDLSQTKELKSFNLYASNKLKEIIGMEDLPKLTAFSIQGSLMEHIDLSGSPLLTSLNVSASKLSSLDITYHPDLLKVSTNQLYAGQQSLPSNGIARTITVRMTADQEKVFNDSNLVNHDNNRNVIVQVP